MKMLNVSRVKARLCEIVKEPGVLAITHHGQVVAFLVSRDAAASDFKTALSAIKPGRARK